MKLLYYKEEDIKKRIEELKKPGINYDGVYVSKYQLFEIAVLEDLLSKGKDVEEIWNIARNPHAIYGDKFENYQEYLEELERIK